MKYYSEELKKVFDSVDELTEAEKELKAKDEHKAELKKQLDALDDKIDSLEKERNKLLDEREKKYREYVKATTSPSGHVTVTKNGKVLMDEDTTLEDGLFGLSHLLKSLY